MVNALDSTNNLVPFQRHIGRNTEKTYIFHLSVPGPKLQETGHHFRNLSLQMLHPLGPAPWQSGRRLPRLPATAGTGSNTYKMTAVLTQDFTGFNNINKHRSEAI